MQKAGFILLAIAFVLTIIVILRDSAAESSISFLLAACAIVGFGLIIAKAFSERMKNKQDNYYDKNVDE